MGKVRKLRKKYKALKVARNKTTIAKKLSENVKYFDTKCISTISKTKNESFLHTVNVSKKTFQKPHLHSSKIHLDQHEKQVSKLNDNLVVTRRHAKFKKSMKVKAKNHRSRKQASQTRQNNLVQDICAFKKTLNEESFLRNPQTVVMNQTLERLSAEEKITGKGIFAKNGN